MLTVTSKPPHQQAKRGWAQHLVKKALFSTQGCDNFRNTLGTKKYLAFSSSSILSKLKILVLCDNFCNTLGTKKSPCFFFLLYIESSPNSGAM